MTRRRVATLILLVWVSSLGWLVLREYGGGRVREDEGWPVPPGSVFQAVRLGARQIGLASLTVDTLTSPPRLRVAELLTVDLPRSPDDSAPPPRTSVRTEAIYTRGLHLTRWQSDLLTEQGRASVTGRVLGDSLLEVVTSAAGTSDTIRATLRKPVVLPSAVPFVARQRGMLRREGRLGLDVLDPLDLEVRSERFVVAAESVFAVADSAEYREHLGRWAAVHFDTLHAWRLEALAEGLRSWSWVDGFGMPVQSNQALGATMERSAFELVSRNYRARARPGRVEGVDLPRFRGPVPPPPRFTTPDGFAARLHLDPPRATGDLEMLSGGIQEVRGDTLLVTRLASLEGPGDTPQVSVLAQAADSLLTRALEAAGVRPDQPPAEAARRVNAWVRRAITLREGPAVSSAGQVLVRRVATPGERTVTLARLLRHAGLEARAVWGLVWRPPAWHLASWVEAGRGTVFAVDPAQAAVPADPARIRLGPGGVPRLLALLLVAGRLRLQPVSGT
ncbi:MAG TPA: transglutaminase-like domain-containing protein [Gemmatimonadales bacterium]|nr:transglutaminase-like domain-containing protein [Gemmatimonadales bacterium]